MLDNVVDITNYPLEKQREQAITKRRIGLGITGLANALAMCRTPYGSKESVELISEWLGAFQRASYWSSIELAKEKGAFPLFDPEKYLNNVAIECDNNDITDAIRKYGIRNSVMNTVAPTGTTSLLANNISSGIEPVFSFSMFRKILFPDGCHREIVINDYAYDLYKKIHDNSQFLPDFFVTASDLTPEQHILMQATVQKYIDASISKTINCPQDISFDDLKNVYIQAYEQGCKGCTTYRPSDVRGYVIKTKSN